MGFGLGGRKYTISAYGECWQKGFDKHESLWKGRDGAVLGDEKTQRFLPTMNVAA